MSSNSSLPRSSEDWLAFCKFNESDIIIPAGHLKPIVGEEKWIDGNGDAYNKADYLAKHGVDPELGWEAVQAYLGNPKVKKL